jgi:hypothetical protein
MSKCVDVNRTSEQVLNILDGEVNTTAYFIT